MWRMYIVVLTVLFVLWLWLFHLRDFQYIKSSGSLKACEERNYKFKHHIPKFMLELYDQIETNPNITPPDVVKSIIPKKQGFELFGKLNKEHSHLLLFEIPKAETDEQFVKAELKILTLNIESMQSTNFDVLEHLIFISAYDDVRKLLIPIERRYVIHKNNTWLSFNMTRIVGKVMQENNFYLKLVILLKSTLPEFKRKLKLSLLPTEVEDYEHDYPILLLTYTSNKKENITRSKRHVDHRDFLDRKLKNSCRKRSLYVNFSEIYYDRWIVQPRGYEAFQCQGRCFYPMANHLSPTKHAVIQSLMHDLYPTRVSKICCVPTKLASISILYIDGGVLTYRFAYKDMVVTECGCR